MKASRALCFLLCLLMAAFLPLCALAEAASVADAMLPHAQIAASEDGQTSIVPPEMQLELMDDVQTVVCKTTKKVGMYAAPSADSEQIAVIPKGKKVSAVVGEDGWSLVTYKEQTGYVVNKYLRTQDGTSPDAAPEQTPQEPATPSYTVRFLDDDGSELKRETVQEGQDATPPEVKDRSGWRFDGWEGGDYRAVTADVTLTARYAQVPTYNVIFYFTDEAGEAQVIDAQLVNEGDAATLPNPPKREGKLFSQWQGAYTDVRAETRVEAVYTDARQFVVRFCDSLNGNKLILEQKVYEQRSALLPDPPEHQGWRFDKWDGNYENVEKDETVYAVYREIVYYTVTFVDWDGTVLSEQQVEQGESAVPPENPSREGYTFTGWEPDYTDVQEDLTVEAQYKEIGEQSDVGVNIGDADIPVGKPGKKIAIAVPVTFFSQENGAYLELFSNARRGTRESKLRYSASNSLAAYDQAITNYARSVRLTLSAEDPASLPFNLDSISASSYVVRRISGENYESLGLVQRPDGYYDEAGAGPFQIGDAYNVGYAVFDGLTIRGNAANGYYPVTFELTWQDAEGETHTGDTITAQVRVTGQKSSSGGGYYSGGGSSVEQPQPQAKLIIDSIRTEPEQPLAGEEFDIVLTLRNTSKTSYLQNLSLTYTAEEDAVLPVDGSNSLYIERIEKDTTREETLHVKSSPNIEGGAVKLDVSMEFEDKKTSALSASQTMIVNIQQKARVQFDELVLPSTSPSAGDSYEVEMAVANMGRTILYNLSARLICENENLAMGQSYYGGNVDPGTSKTVELECTPLEEGDYPVTLEITYEDAEGNATVERKDFSLTAVPLEDYSNYYYEDPYQTEPIEPEPQAPAAQEIMAALPWWLYAAVGGILLLVVVSLSVGARNKRRRMLEDDEMD